MEKLQAALEKARHKRQEHPVAPGPAAKPVRQTEEAHQHNLWTAVAPFELSDDLLQTHRVVTRQASPAAAPFDILRTKLLVQMRQHGWKRLAVAFTSSECG